MGRSSRQGQPEVTHFLSERENSYSGSDDGRVNSCLAYCEEHNAQQTGVLQGLVLVLSYSWLVIGLNRSRSGGEKSGTVTYS